MKIIKDHGKTVRARLGPTFFPLRTGLFTADYHLIEFILSGNKVLNKTENYQFFREWLGKGLLISDGRLLLLFSIHKLRQIIGDYWRRHRKILTPTFHFDILKGFVEVFESMGDVLVGKMEKYDETPSLDLHPFVTLCTLDIICGAYNTISHCEFC